MDKQQFWIQIQQFTQQSAHPAEVIQLLWERFVQLASAPTLPVELICRTVCEGAVYLRERVPLNLPPTTPAIQLSSRQMQALELGLSNSPLAVICGLPGSGKTTIAAIIAQTAIEQEKRVLLVSRHETALAAFARLPGYPFRLSQQQYYEEWLSEQLRQRLNNPRMDYLPLHLLPDRELAKLRNRTALETWLPLLQTVTFQELAQRLKQTFPSLAASRIQLLAQRLQELEPLLKQQLQLSQLYNTLSEQGMRELTNQFCSSSQIPILSTVAELLQSPSFWSAEFDVIIVEQAETLDWIELLWLAGLGQKLVLLGTPALPRQRLQTPDASLFFSRFPRGFYWLSQHLLPTYRCDIPEQFRLHSELATPIYSTLCDRWIQSRTPPSLFHLPRLSHRLIWQDVPGLPIGHDASYQNPLEGQRIFEFLQQLDLSTLSQAGIITFYCAQRDWLQANCPLELADVKIGTVEEWVGQERAVILISCVGQPDRISAEEMSIALTRGQDYVILFGHEDRWWQSASLMRSLLAHSELQIERMAVLA